MFFWFFRTHVVAATAPGNQARSATDHHRSLWCGGRPSVSRHDTLVAIGAAALAHALPVAAAAPSLAFALDTPAGFVTVPQSGRQSSRYAPALSPGLLIV